MEESIAEAKNRAHRLLSGAEDDLSSGRITDPEYYERICAVITPAYLAGDNPRAQSGHSGDERHWHAARSLLLDAIPRGGTFFDVGCANGYLMESLHRWALGADRLIEPHGLDISPQLAELARQRVPMWADRIHVGNAIDWEPPQRYDFVRTGLEYVPTSRRPQLVRRLLEQVVAPGGHLILGTYNEETPEMLQGPTLEEEVTSWGFGIAGRTERPHFHDSRLRYKAIWVTPVS